MGKKNVASGNDRVAVQVGQVHGKTAKPTNPAKDAGTTETVNIRSGNATVGRQTDVITGDLNISF